MSDSKRSTARYRLLIDQLADELGDPRPWGWQTTVAKRLGIKPATVSRIYSGDRGAGREVLDLAMRRLRLRPSFFYDSAPSDPQYRDYCGLKQVPQDTTNAAFDAFVSAAPTLGIQLSEAEREQLQSYDFDRGKPTIQTYVFLLHAMRSVAPESASVHPPPPAESDRRSGQERRLSAAGPRRQQ